MRDSRIDALAQILVRYSTKVQPGETCAIRATTNAEPLVQAIYEEILRAGGHPFFALSPVEALPAFFELANDEQLDYVAEPMRWPYEKADVAFAIMADANTHALSDVDPARQSRVQKARKPLLNASMGRTARGEHRWVLTMFPTHSYAADAGMSLARFEEFLFRACLVYDDDPVTAWERQSDTVKRLADWMDGKEEIRFQTPAGTDIRLNIAGRTWIPCYGDHNMPDGEFFTGPVEDSAEGVVAFSFPTSYGGREVGGVTLRFENGKVVDAKAERGEELLLQTLDTDEGARRLGELGIGTNYGIKTGTKEILLDEKIGGTFHLALGASYPETGGVNDSAVHWDMICDLRDGGSITVDGEKLQESGQFLV
jgi:aminopeptidase